MNDKEIIALLQRQLEVSQAAVDSLRAAMSEMRQSMESTIVNLKETIRSLEKALLDKGVETAKAKKALRNVAAMMEKHSERQPVDNQPDPEFTPKEENPKYNPQGKRQQRGEASGAHGVRGARGHRGVGVE